MKNIYVQPIKPHISYGINYIYIYAVYPIRYILTKQTQWEPWEYFLGCSVQFFVFDVFYFQLCIIFVVCFILPWSSRQQDNNMSMVSCQKGPTRHAYAWPIGPFWQDTLELSNWKERPWGLFHYIDVIMTTMTSQITSLAVVSSTVYSEADQRKQHWPLCGEFTGDRWIPRAFPAQMASNAENVSIWWRHHVIVRLHNVSDKILKYQTWSN